MRRYVLEGWLILAVLCLLATAIVAGGIWTLQNYTEYMPQQQEFDCEAGEQPCRVGGTDPLDTTEAAFAGAATATIIGSLWMLNKWERGANDDR